jgi:adenylosuccinate lyase
VSHNLYISPFSSRYASKEISYLFSQEFKILSFRRLWISLAKAQKKLGLKITDAQIQEMQSALSKIDFEKAAQFEKKFRHDVMAHIHTFASEAPSAKPIIHLGATSCYVTDNSELIQSKEALFLLLQKGAYLLKILSHLALKEANTPCLAYTHYQPAQPTTFGKRFALWLQDFFLDMVEWERLYRSLPFLGAKGATGTAASFLTLFDGDHEKVIAMEKMIAEEFGFTNILPISGQTYTRKIDLFLLNAFSSFAASAHKMATDIRLLSHDKELMESFDPHQVGSSAMPYKKNPIYSERTCGIARFVISLGENPAYTVATQWLERSLDDSSNRRLSIPEAFLGVDAILNLLIHLTSHLTPMKNVALENLQKELPSLVTENLLMAAVKKGKDRQDLHEKLRLFAPLCKSMEALIEAVEKDPSFGLQREEIKSLASLSSLIGRAPFQVQEFVEKVEEKLNEWNFQKPTLTPVEI